MPYGKYWTEERRTEKVSKLKKMIQRTKHFFRKKLQVWYYDPMLDRKLKRKVANGEKLRVLFICHRPAVWGALKTVYEAFREDNMFETLMVTVPQVDCLNPAGYVDEGADTFFREYDPVIGFDKDTKQYLDIKSLKPDIVFFQQPYDVMRERNYRSNQVNKYAKIAYVSYFSIFPKSLNDVAVLNTCYPTTFFSHISYFFSQNTEEDEHIRKLLEEAKIYNTKVFLTGYPKYDDLNRYKDASPAIWNRPDDNNGFKILWTPRWTTNENNCHFFDYIDRWFDFCGENPNVDFVFRPHPQAWTEWAHTGEFTPRQQAELRNQFSQMDNMSIDESKEYLETFYSSDCLVSDVSSMALQYILTGKPVVYCHKQNGKMHFIRDSVIGSSLYWAENWDEVKGYLQQLKKGMDPLKEKRLEAIRTEYRIDSQIKAGEKIKESIKQCLIGE